MYHRALAACLLVLPGALARAEDAHIARLRPPESTVPLLPVPETPANPPLTEFSTAAGPGTESPVVPSAESLAVPSLDRLPTEVSDAPSGEPGLFLDGDLSLIISNLRGDRATLPQYRPVASWRLPGLNAAGLTGGVGIGTDTVSQFAGIRLAAGYRLDGGWGEFIVAVRWAAGARERWYANGDSRADWFVQS